MLTLETSRCPLFARFISPCEFAVSLNRSYFISDWICQTQNLQERLFVSKNTRNPKSSECFSHKPKPMNSPTPLSPLNMESSMFLDCLLGVSPGFPILVLFFSYTWGVYPHVIDRSIPGLFSTLFQDLFVCQSEKGLSFSNQTWQRKIMEHPSLIFISGVFSLMTEGIRYPVYPPWGKQTNEGVVGPLLPR